MNNKSHFIKLTVIFKEEKDGRFSVTCEELNISTFGKTLSEARARLDEAICLQLQCLVEENELFNTLERNGVKLQQKREPKTVINVPTRKNIFAQSSYFNIDTLQHAGAC